MRTALVLLVVLAAASILGSLFPQEGLSPQRVDQYFADHPALAPVLERLGLFDVFGSAWYMAIYLALLGALVACLVPRTRALVRVLRSRPPRGGDLARYRTRASFDTPASPDQAMAAARRVLRRNRFRLAEHDTGELAGEKGYLREAASLLFHVSLLVLLVGLAYGKGYGYRGQAAIVEGETWANARVGYDSFSPGRFFGPERLAPFQLRLDDFTNSFHPDNTPREFVSRLTALDLDGRELQAQRVAPNRPMTVDGVRIFQSDYGYVPVVGVRDKAGRELLAPQEVLTLRDPASEWSTGAVKVTRSDPQVGLELTMFTGLVTAPDCPGGAPFCNDPRLVRPVLVVLAYQGDLRADRAQSVFTLDRTRLRPLGDRPAAAGPRPVQGAGQRHGGVVHRPQAVQRLHPGPRPGGAGRGRRRRPAAAGAGPLAVRDPPPGLGPGHPGRAGRHPGRAGRPRPPGQGRLRGRAGPAGPAGGTGGRGLMPSPPEDRGTLDPPDRST